MKLKACLISLEELTWLIVDGYIRPTTGGVAPAAVPATELAKV
mgnify:CR=1 FL=1